MFDKILIANRGEIACRIIRTARRLEHPHRRGLFRARCAGAACRGGRRGAPDRTRTGARELSVDRAYPGGGAQSGAQAIHPGYGFLSENAEFAERCADAGIVFIGPSAATIRAIGDKAQAKIIMERAGVATVPGYHGQAQDAARFAQEAERLGYPVLIKATAGGGGRGMRAVTEPGELGAALDSARNEALSAFGNGQLILEKYLARPRHVEVQVFGDQHGHVVHLFERDCSAQRRHQKVIEESPAPMLDEALRRSSARPRSRPPARPTMSAPARSSSSSMARLSTSSR